MSSSSVKSWRINTKLKIIKIMGGSCIFCGYTKCHNALELHHIDPNTKDFSLASIRASPKNWGIILEELKKCVLICANCHRELHAGLLNNPTKSSIIEDPETNDIDSHTKHNCPICQNPTESHKKFCSRKCAAKNSGKVNWDSINLEALLLNGHTYSSISRILNCSEAAVRKRLKKQSKTISLYRMDNNC